MFHFSPCGPWWLHHQYYAYHLIIKYMDILLSIFVCCLFKKKTNNRQMGVCGWEKALRRLLFVTVTRWYCLLKKKMFAGHIWFNKTLQSEAVSMLWKAVLIFKVLIITNDPKVINIIPSGCWSTSTVLSSTVGVSAILAFGMPPRIDCPKVNCCEACNNYKCKHLQPFKGCSCLLTALRKFPGQHRSALLCSLPKTALQKLLHVLYSVPQNGKWYNCLKLITYNVAL